MVNRFQMNYTVSRLFEANRTDEQDQKLINVKYNHEKRVI